MHHGYGRQGQKEDNRAAQRPRSRASLVGAYAEFPLDMRVPDGPGLGDRNHMLSLHQLRCRRVAVSLPIVSGLAPTDDEAAPLMRNPWGARFTDRGSAAEAPIQAKVAGSRPGLAPLLCRFRSCGTCVRTGALLLRGGLLA